MRLTQVPYEQYARTIYTERKLVRAFHRWTAWSAHKDGRLLLLLDEYVRRRVTVCEYDTEAEREADIRVLLSLRDSILPPRSSGGSTPPPINFLALPDSANLDPQNPD